MSSLITFFSPPSRRLDADISVFFFLSLSLASVNVRPYLKLFSFVFIKTSHRVRTHLAQVPFTLDVFFCSLSLLTTFSIKRLALEIFILFFVSLSYSLSVYVYVSPSLSLSSPLLHTRRYIRMRDITQFFLFRKIFICSVLISFLLI